jgi:integrase
MDHVAPRGLRRVASTRVVCDGAVRSNPGAAARRPGVERKDAPHLTAEQAQALLEAIKGDRLETSFRLMLATGLRRGEALALHWSDVDLDAVLLRVRWTLARTSQELQLDEPKTDKSRRTVPLPRSAVEALRSHRAQQGERRAAAGAWLDNGLVFTTEIGTPLEPRNGCGGSGCSRSEPVSAASPCTPSGTLRRPSCWRPAPTPRSSRSTSVTRRTPSRPTSTATWVAATTGMATSAPIAPNRFAPTMTEPRATAGCMCTVRAVIRGPIR